MDPATRTQVMAALQSAVIPAGVVLAVSVAGLAIPRIRRLALPLGLIAGAAAGLVATDAFPPIPPVNSRGWIILLGPTAGLLALVAGALPLTRVQRAATALLGAAVYAFLLVRPLFESKGTATGALFVASGALPIALPGLALAAGLRSGDPAPPVLATTGLAALAGSAASILSGSALVAQLHGALAAALGASVALSWIVPRLRATPAMVAAPVAILGGLQVYGLAFVPLPLVPSLVVVCVPLAGLGAMSLAREGRMLRALVVATLIALLPVAAAAGVAWSIAAQEAAADPYGGAY